VRLNSLHGYYIFREDEPGEIADFMQLTSFRLVQKDDYFTFEFLGDAKNYSILGGLYLGAVATKSFEGTPWKVMRENGLVYDFTLNLVVPIQAVLQKASITQGIRYYLSSAMLLSGSITDDGSRVKDYAAFFDFDQGTFKYSEVSFE
jgi:hypothetical protein